MNGPRSRPIWPALAAGAAAGALSSLPYAGCLCCLWIIGGGIAAGFLLVRSSPVPPPPGDAARIGALAGVAAAAVSSLMSIPLARFNAAFARRFLERMAEYVPEMPAGWESWLTQGGGAPLSLPWFLAGFVLNAAVFAALAALGGTIGVNLFVQRSGAAPSNPPEPGSPS